MRRIALLSIVLALVAVATGCSTAPRACTCACHRQHATPPPQTAKATATNHALTTRRAPERSRYPSPSSGVRTYATGSSYTSAPRSYSSAGGYVRLRGSPVVHVRGCPKVLRAASGGAVPCRKSDGPPCYTCRHAEAIRAARNR